MSHELDFSRGKAAIAYKGETPWHGLGESMQPGMSIEEWITAAGLDYEVQKYLVEYQVGEEYYAYNNRVVLARTDTGQALGLASASHFKIVQPRDVVEFYRDLCESHGYELETAGALKGGARVWALAKVGQTLKIDRKDKLETYLLLATGMDGKFATVCRLTTVRVVCNNTLTAALPNYNKIKTDLSGGIIKLRHSQDFDAQQVKLDLGLIKETATEFGTLVKSLAEYRMKDEEAKDYFARVLTKKGEVDEERIEQLDNKLTDLMLAYKKGPGAELPTAQDTLWGAVNAVSYLTDHVAGRGAASRLDRAWFGSNERLKNRALQIAYSDAGLVAA